jgi:hypothetical protein
VKHGCSHTGDEAVTWDSAGRNAAAPAERRCSRNKTRRAGWGMAAISQPVGATSEVWTADGQDGESEAGLDWKGW